MNYLGIFFGQIRIILEFIWGVADKIFSYATPLGLSFVFGLIISFIIIRYLVFPFLR